MKKLLLLIALLVPFSSYAKELIQDFEWLEPNNTIEIVIGEPYQLHYSCSNNNLAFTSDYADSWVHVDFSGGQHVVDPPTGYSIDENGIITGLVSGSYAIHPTGWIQRKSGAEKWLYITVISERTETEPNNTLDTANEITSKIRFGLYNISDIDFFKYTNSNLKWGDEVTFKIHYYGSRENPFGYKWSIFCGTDIVSGGSLISQDQECKALVTSGNTVYLEVYYNQSHSEYFLYGEEFVVEVYINGVPAIEYGDSDAYCGEGVTYTLVDGTLTISKPGSGSGYMYDYPQGGTPWYNERNQIKHIIVESGVKSIGNYAFGVCQYLESVTLPEGLEYIHIGAFNNCGMEEIVIPNSVIEIGESAFNNSRNLNKVILGKNLEKILTGAFSGTLLNYVYCYAPIPPELSGYCFQTQNRLYVPSESVNLYKTTPVWKDFALILPINEEPVEQEDNKCGENLTYYYFEEDKTLTISGTGEMWNYSYTNYQSTPWNNISSKIEKIIIEEGVTSIGSFVFYKCAGVRTLSIPNSVTSIGISAFWGCSSLESVIIPNSVISIDDNVFFGCSSLSSVILGNSVTSIGQSSFASCTGLTSITIPNSINSLGAWAFNSENLRTVISQIENPFYIIGLNLEEYSVFHRNTFTNGTLYVPVGTIDKYKNVGGWSYFSTIKEGSPDNGEQNEMEYVDLGLPSGLMWAKTNVGASSPEESGYYYAWGETTPNKTLYDATTYTDPNISNISGTEYDAAYTTSGGKWRMPTYDEFIELNNNCSWELTQVNSINGYRVVGKNGNSIFFPFVGGKEGDHNVGYSEYGYSGQGFYASGTAFPYNNNYNWYLYMDTDPSFGMYGYYKTRGQTIRPVKNLSSHIDGIINDNSITSANIYKLNGQLVLKNTNLQEAAKILPSGIYVTNGKKFIVK